MSSSLGFQSLGAVRSRRDQIIDTLRAAIISGELDTTTLYSAPALAADFGVSATPVREAMLQLANEGLIEVVRNKGYRVLEPSDQALAEIAELRTLLEVPVVGAIARQGLKPPEERALRALANETLSAAKAGDVTRHVSADIAFHLQLLALAGNEQLVEIIRMLRSRSRLFGLRSPDRAALLTATSQEHIELVKLVRDRDVKGAERLMRQHIAHTRVEWARPQDAATA